MVIRCIVLYKPLVFKTFCDSICYKFCHPDALPLVILSETKDLPPEHPQNKTPSIRLHKQPYLFHELPPIAQYRHPPHPLNEEHGRQRLRAD